MNRRANFAGPVGAVVERDGIKTIQTSLLLALTIFAIPSRGYLFVELPSIDDYVRLGQTIVLAECFPNDEDPVYSRAFRRKVRVINVLKGDLKKDQIFHVLASRPLEVGHVYMIYSGETISEKGELNARSYEPGIVEVVLWGEIPKTEKAQRVASFLTELEPLSLRDKLVRILDRRRKAMKWEQQQLDIEKSRLENLLSK